MKQAILTACIVLTVFPAKAANWFYVTESSVASNYIDTQSIRIEGERRRVWQMSDRKVNGTNGSRSSRSLVEYDCKEARSRFLQGVNFTGQEASGNIVSMTNEASQWSYVDPGTTGELLFQAACKFVP